MPKKTMVIGASENSERYANIATKRLLQYMHPVVLLGIKAGQINEQPILVDKPKLNDIDTVTLYVGPKNQAEWFDYVVSLNPKRVIFNPGTENKEFYRVLEVNKREVVEACTLVMLSIGDY